MSLPLLHAGRTNPGLSAALDLRFALDKSLTAYRGPTPSFSRASTGTYFNSSGVLTSAAINAPRFNHTFNGTSWVSRGLLVEEQRTNLVKRSEEFNTSPWTNSDVTISSNQVVSPDGNTTADKVQENSATNYHAVYQLFPYVGNFTFSVFVKGGERTWCYIGLYSVSHALAWFNLSTGVVGTVSGTAPPAASIQNVGNGWFRCSVTGNVPATGGSVSIGPATGDNAGSYSGTTGSGIYVYGAQAEAGAFPTSYIPTTSASTTRSADVCQITGTNFSGFWNGTEGSVVAEFDRISSTSGSYVLTAYSSGINQTISVYGDSSNIEAYTWGGSSYQSRFIYPSLSTGQFYKLSYAYKSNDFAASLNGGSALTDTSGSVASASELNIGNYNGTGNYIINGHIARLRYYNKRLPNATLQQLSDPDPTLNLQFALNKSLTPVAGPAPSFSRASAGSYFDSTGTLKYANVNICTYSEQINDTSWNFPSNATIAPNAAVSPNGTTTADLLYPTASGANCYTGKSVGSVSLVTYTNSYYLKSAGKTWATIYSIRGAFIAWFNLVNGTVGTTQTGVTATIQNSGNGWWRCSVTRTADLTTGYTFVGVADSNGSESITKNGTDGILVWGAQSEIGNSATDYASTTSAISAGPRFDHVYSGGQWASRGLLLEEQRTNYCLQSAFQSGWTVSLTALTANQDVSPDGTTTAAKLVPSSTGIYRSVYQSITNSNCLSVYAKASGMNWISFINTAGSAAIAWFNISSGTVGTVSSGYTGTIQNVGNGWYRCTVTNASNFAFIQINLADADNTATATLSGTNGVLLWGAQAESGAFPTSYIGTTSSSVVRSTDVCQITGTSFNSMWNQGEGSLIADFDFFSSANAVPWTALTNTTNIIQLYRSGATDLRGFVYASGIVQADFSIGTYSNPSKSAVAYKSNDFAGSANGAAVGTDTSGTIPSTDKLYLMAEETGSISSGHIAKLIYYPARLTNTKLQQLST